MEKDHERPNGNHDSTNATGARPGVAIFIPNALYSYDALRRMLEGIVELDTVLRRLNLRDRRVFRDAVWGWEILDAARLAGLFSEKVNAGIPISPANRHPRRSGARGVRRLGVADLEGR